MSLDDYNKKDFSFLNKYSKTTSSKKRRSGGLNVIQRNFREELARSQDNIPSDTKVSPDLLETDSKTFSGPSIEIPSTQETSDRKNSSAQIPKALQNTLINKAKPDNNSTLPSSKVQNLSINQPTTDRIDAHSIGLSNALFFANTLAFHSTRSFNLDHFRDPFISYCNYTSIYNNEIFLLSDAATAINTVNTSLGNKCGTAININIDKIGIFELAVTDAAAFDTTAIITNEKITTAIITPQETPPATITTQIGSFDKTIEFKDNSDTYTTSPNEIITATITKNDLLPINSNSLIDSSNNSVPAIPTNIDNNGINCGAALDTDITILPSELSAAPITAAFDTTAINTSYEFREKIHFLQTAKGAEEQKNSKRPTVTKRQALTFDIDPSSTEIHETRFTTKFTICSQEIFNFLHSLKHPAHKMLTLKLFRLSFGYNQSKVTNIPVSNSFLSNGTGLGIRIVEMRLPELCTSGIVERVGIRNNVGSFYQINFLNNFDTKIPSSFFIIDNNVLDAAMLHLDSNEFLIYFYLYCKSFGLGQNITKERISQSEIEQNGNIAEKTVRNCLSKLFEDGWIKRAGGRSKDGSYYRVFLPHEILNIQKANIQYRASGIKFVENSEHNHQTAAINTTALVTPRNNAGKSTAITMEGFNAEQSINSLNHKTYGSTAINSGGNIADKENQKSYKTSSGDADDIQNFKNLIKELFQNLNRFPISDQSIARYFENFGAERCKTHLLRLKERILIAKSPVGFWINSLKQPDNYPELAQRSESETLEEKRLLQETEQKARIKATEEKAIQEKLSLEAWTQLSEDDRNGLLTEAEEFFRSIMPNGKLPPDRAILEKARAINYELQEKRGDVLLNTATETVPPVAGSGE